MIRLDEKISEDEFLIEFLSAEFQSPRHRPLIQYALEANDLTEGLVLEPDSNNFEGNRQRKALLAELKGYGRNSALFEHFPTQVTWWKGTVSRDAQDRIFVLNQENLHSHLGDSRTLLEASEYLRKTPVASDLWIPHIADKLTQGRAFRPILVGTTTDKLVILDGHVRLISWVLATNEAINEINVLVGLSPTMDNWNFY